MQRFRIVATVCSPVIEMIVKRSGKKSADKTSTQFALLRVKLQNLQNQMKKWQFFAKVYKTSTQFQRASVTISLGKKPRRRVATIALLRR
jgi:hypothetical protein